MMKQRRILSVIAIFIAVYMTAALGWWTFSLLRYSEAESHLQLKILKTRKQLCFEKFKAQHIGQILGFNQNMIKSKVTETEFHNLQKNTLTIAKYYGMDYSIEKTKKQGATLWVTVVFSIKSDAQKRIQNKLRNKQNAWLGEGITVGFITLLIIGFMYFYLEKILRFNQQKANFMMAVTHELKTPIAAAKLAIQTVIRNKNQDNQDRVLAISKQNIDRLSGLMERVLLATQFENRLPTKNEKWISVHEVINNAIDDGQFEISQTLKKYLVESKDFLILCDVQMFKIVFINLFTNAIKYSDDSCVNVVVKSFIQEGNFGVSISDEGIGIATGERNHIFEKFYRIGDEKTRSRQGSGLGLYLVKQILQLHKASIDVTPNLPNGSKFTITFNPNECRME